MSDNPQPPATSCGVITRTTEGNENAKTGAARHDLPIDLDAPIAEDTRGDLPELDRYRNVIFHLNEGDLIQVSGNIGRLTPDDHWPAAVFVGAEHWNPPGMSRKENARIHQQLGTDFYHRWRKGEFPDINVVPDSHKPALYCLKQMPPETSQVENQPAPPDGTSATRQDRQRIELGNS